MWPPRSAKPIAVVCQHANTNTRTHTHTHTHRHTHTHTHRGVDPANIEYERVRDMAKNFRQAAAAKAAEERERGASPPPKPAFRFGSSPSWRKPSVSTHLAFAEGREREQPTSQASF